MLNRQYSSIFEDALREWEHYADVDLDVSIGWSDLSGGLAVTRFSPNGTTITFDPDAQDNFYEVALHEIGHALGLPHIDESDAVMNTHGGSESGWLTDTDIEAILNFYMPSDFVYGNSIDIGSWDYGWFQDGWWAWGWHLEDGWDYGWYQSQDGWSWGWYIHDGWEYGWYSQGGWEYGWWYDYGGQSYGWGWNVSYADY